MITVKEEFPGSVKTQRAIELGGYEAIFLWLCLKGYVAAGNTGGFIPGEAVPLLPGVPKRWERCMEALVGCGKLREDGTRGDGLVERVPHGWRLHDYEDHGTPVEVEDERRRKSREQKRRRRAVLEIGRLAQALGVSVDLGGLGDAEVLSVLERLRGQVRGQTPDNGSGHNSGQAPDNGADSPPDSPRARAGAGPAAGAREREPQPSPAQPEEIQPDRQSQDLTGGAPGEARSGRGGWKISCPAGLTLTEQQLQTYELSPGIPREAARAIAGALVGNWVVKSEPKSPDGWLQYLGSSVVRWWNDPDKRREVLRSIAPDPEPSEDRGPDGNHGYGAPEEWA